MGMRQRPGQGKRLLTPLEGLVWVAKQPQGKGCKAPAAYPGIMPAIEKGMRAVLLEVVEGHTLLCVLASRGYFSEVERGGPQRVVGLQEESGILYTLSQTEELLPQFPRRL